MTPHLGLVIWLGFVYKGSVDYVGSLKGGIYFKKVILYSCFHDGLEKNYVLCYLKLFGGKIVNFSLVLVFTIRIEFILKLDLVSNHMATIFFQVSYFYIPIFFIPGTYPFQV